MVDQIVNFPLGTFESSVVLKRTGPENLHAGIIYKDIDGESKILHFAFHLDLKNDKISEIGSNPENIWNQGDLWAFPTGLVDIQRRMVSHMCWKILKRLEEDKIKYGLLYDGSTYFMAEDGKYMLGENCSGLTCSTFVLAVFKSSGISLVDVTKWPKRDNDTQALGIILEYLKGKCEEKGDMSHYERVMSNEVGCERFRPSEVTASITFDEIPAPCEQIWARGEEIAIQALLFK